MRTYVVVIVTLIFIAFVGIIGLAGMKVSEGFSPEKSFYRGKKEFEIGNYQEATHYFNDYLALNRRSDKNIISKYYIALSLKRLDKLENAKQYFALLINASDDEVRLAREFTSYRVKSIIEYADICRLQNRYEHYIMGQLELVLKFPNEPNIERQLTTQFGYQLLLKREYEEAINYFLRANSELALLGKARAYYELGEIDKSFGVYEEFIRYNKDSSYFEEVYATFKKQAYYQATLHYDREDYDKAIVYFSKIAEVYPESIESEQSLFYIGESYYTMAGSYYEKGAFEEASSRFEKAVLWYAKAAENKEERLDDAALLKIGMSYYWMKKYASCYKAMDKFLYEYPNSKYASAAREWKNMAKKDLEYMHE